MMNIGNDEWKDECDAHSDNEMGETAAFLATTNAWAAPGLCNLLTARAERGNQINTLQPLKHICKFLVLFFF